MCLVWFGLSHMELEQGSGFSVPTLVASLLTVRFEQVLGKGICGKGKEEDNFKQAMHLSP